MLMHYILWEKMMEGCLLEEFFLWDVNGYQKPTKNGGYVMGMGCLGRKMGVFENGPPHGT